MEFIMITKKLLLLSIVYIGKIFCADDPTGNISKKNPWVGEKKSFFPLVMAGSYDVKKEKNNLVLDPVFWNGIEVDPDSLTKKVVNLLPQEATMRLVEAARQVGHFDFKVIINNKETRFIKINGNQQNGYNLIVYDIKDELVLRMLSTSMLFVPQVYVSLLKNHPSKFENINITYESPLLNNSSSVCAIQ
jgi:hypothetical protein